MQKYILPIGLILLGLAIGQLVRRQAVLGRLRYPERIGKLMKFLQQLVLLGLNPAVTLGVFWGASYADVRYIFIPFLGVFAIFIGAVMGLTASKIFRHDKRKTGAMFCSASFTNLGSFGTLVSFLFFGEAGFVIVSLYRLFEELAYFLVGFPIAKRFGMEASANRQRHPVLRILGDPYILVYLVCILAGTVLNFSGPERPGFYPILNSALVPISSLLLVVTVGFNMKLGAIRGYMKECLTVFTVKFIVTPVVILTLALLAGLGGIQDGLALRVVLVLSAMPPAFYSLIPPQIYGLDMDLANSCWVFNSGIFILLIPVLYLVQGLL